MKILAIADTHISEHHGRAGHNPRREADGLRQSLADGRDALEWCAKVADEHGADMVIHAGDVFDRSKPTPGEVAIARRGLRRVIGSRPHVVVTGNHDIGYGAGIHAMTPLQHDEGAETRYDKGYTVHAAPDVVRLHLETERGRSESVEVFTLPYPNTKTTGTGGARLERNAQLSTGLDAILADLAWRASQSNADATVLVSHVTFGGSEYDSGQPVAMHDVKVSTALLGAFDFVVAGHLHKRQKIGGMPHAWYIGPPTRWSFNDEGNPAGAAIIDTVSGEFSFAENDTAPKFQTITAEEVLRVAPHFHQHTWRTLARITGTVGSESEYDTVEDWIRRVSEAGTVEHIRNDVRLDEDHRAEVEGLDVRDDHALFDHYVESRPDAIPPAEVDATRDVVREVLADVAS